MKFTLRKKIILSAILPLLLLGASIIIIAATIVKGSIISKVEESLKGTAVATQAAYDQNAGSYLKAENGAIWKGSYNISQSETLVDTIKEESGMDVTFFYGSDRIMTSAKDKDGNRLLGSPAGDKIKKRVLEQGKEHFHRWNDLLRLLCAGLSGWFQGCTRWNGFCRSGKAENISQCP